MEYEVCWSGSMEAKQARAEQVQPQCERPLMARSGSLTALCYHVLLQHGWLTMADVVRLTRGNPTSVRVYVSRLRKQGLVERRYVNHQREFRAL